jgi:two-component system NarL family response regulator
MNDPGKIRLLLVDDHFFVRAGLISSLESEPDILVVGQASTGRGAVAKFAEVRPDVTLMDGRLPDLMGVEAVQEIIAGDSGARIIMLTVNETEEHIHRALKAGVRGYLPKSTERDELLHAIRLVHSGAIYQPAAIRARVTARRQRNPLSPREVEVLQMIAQGLANKEIADRLNLSEATVKTHVRNLLIKLEVPDRSGAVFVGMEQGLVQVE